MKHLKLIGLCLLVALALSACATANHTVVYQSTSFTQAELNNWKAYYDILETSQASSMEKWLMEKGNPDQSLAQQFSWLNPNQLSQKDKLFLIRVKKGGKIFMPGLFSLPSSDSHKRQK